MARLKTVVGFASRRPDFKGDGSAPTDAGIYVTRRRVNDAFLHSALNSWAKDGDKALAAAAREQPSSYLKIFALLMPRELKIEHTNPTAALSDEQLALMIAELEQRIAHRLAGGDAKTIEHQPAPRRKRGRPKGSRNKPPTTYP
jgi:hypothetical protein